MRPLIDLLQNLRPATHSLGIEITDTSIKAVEMKFGRNGDFSLLGFEMEPLPDMAVDDGRVKELYSVIGTIQSLVAKLNPKTKRVHMVAPSQAVMIRFLKLPDIPLKELQKLVDFEVKHNIHLPFEQPVYDFIKLNGSESTNRINKKNNARDTIRTEKNKLDPSDDWMNQAAPAKEDKFGLGGKNDLLFGESAESDALDDAGKLQCDVMLVAAPGELIQEYTQIAQAAGLNLQSIEIKALSLFRFIHETGLTDAQETFIVLDVNAKASDVTIFHEGTLKITRSLPITIDVSNQADETRNVSALDTLFADFTQESPVKTAANDLTHELERLMNFYRYTLNNRNQVFDRLMLSGDVPFLSELAVLLEEKLSIPVVVMDTEGISDPNSQSKVSLPAYAVAVGLALRGAK